MIGPDLSPDDGLPAAALVVARRVAAGATLWCVSPSWPEHARHVAVEFVHPVIVGTRAVPAVAVHGPDPVAEVRAVVRPGDVVVAVSTTQDPLVVDLLGRTPAWGVTSVWLAAGPPAPQVRADVVLRVDDPQRSAPFDGQLVLRYHMLWELTHVCFEHPDLLVEAPFDVAACVTCRDEGHLGEVVEPSADGLDVDVRTGEGRERVDATLVGPLERDDLVLVHAGSAIARVDAPVTDFLYPFLDRAVDQEEGDLDALLVDLTSSVSEKVRVNAELRATTIRRLQGAIEEAARAMAGRFRAGGRLFAFGNGGSSTDAATLIALFATPPSGPALPAQCLVDDTAVLTALANDVGFSLVFSRQLLAHARSGDMAVGFSTSGNSEDLLVAFGAAKQSGVLTVGFAGYDGGDMGRAGLDHCLVVESDSVHRIQETQAALGFALWQAVHLELAASAVDA